AVSIWKNAMPHRKNMNIGFSDLHDSLRCYEFKIGKENSKNLEELAYKALIQAILEDAKVGSPTRKYYAGIVTTLWGKVLFAIFINNRDNLIPWNRLEALKITPNSWEKTNPELYTEFLYLKKFECKEPDENDLLEAAREINERNEKSKSLLEAKTSEEQYQAYIKSKGKFHFGVLSKTDIYKEIQRNTPRYKELDQYYTPNFCQEGACKIFSDLNIKYILDPCCGDLSVPKKYKNIVSDSDYVGNDIDPNITSDVGRIDAFKDNKKIYTLIPKEWDMERTIEYTNPPFSKRAINCEESPFNILYDGWLNQKNGPRYLGLWFDEDMLPQRKLKCIKKFDSMRNDWPCLTGNSSDSRNLLISLFIFDRFSQEVSSFENWEFEKPNDAISEHRTLLHKSLDFYEKNNAYRHQIIKIPGKFPRLDLNAKTPSKMLITNGKINTTIKWGQPMIKGFWSGQTNKSTKNKKRESFITNKYINEFGETN
ncbi:MAG: hypothetical protein LBD41_04310, partial [Clostridiales Family XIII bacterium]|nr:hypothetical protein [Clostridiales Family XIII bacterium]